MCVCVCVWCMGVYIYKGYHTEYAYTLKYIWGVNHPIAAGGRSLGESAL